MIRLIITPLAEEDIEAIADYIARGDPAFFEADEHQVVIVRILHGARDLPVAFVNDAA